jgi:RHS repeat-associated protein
MTFSYLRLTTYDLQLNSTGHEHLEMFALINMNNRMYDPVIGRMLAPDNYVQEPGFTQNYNRYSYAWNNPLVYTDPDGDVVVTAIIVGAVMFGTGNLAAQAMAGNVNSFGDGLRAFGAGALAGAVVGAGVGIGLGVPVLGTGLQVAWGLYGTSTLVGAVSGIGHGVRTGDWSRLENTGKIALGNFYLDENRSVGQQTLQGVSRFSWEIFQTTAGHAFSQGRNTIGDVDRVEYFGGATFSITENADTRTGRGISIGNHINAWIPGEYTGVINEPILMHEYGHTFDSQIFGPYYALVIGPMSLYSASSRFSGNHRDQWYEQSPNYHASKYFEDYYDVDWMSDPHPHEPAYTIGELNPSSPFLRGSWLYRKR